MSRLAATKDARGMRGRCNVRRRQRDSSRGVSERQRDLVTRCEGEAKGPQSEGDLSSLVSKVTRGRAMTMKEVTVLQCIRGWSGGGDDDEEVAVLRHDRGGI